MKRPRATSELRELYERRLRVRHVAIFDLETTSLEEDALSLRDLMGEKDFHVMPVQENGSIERYVLRQELGIGSVRDFVRPLSVADLLADSTPLLDAMAMFEHRDWFFVLVGNRVAGIVTLADLRRPPVQMFLFALISLLESKMSRLIREFEPDSWDSMLGRARLVKAKDLLEDRQRRGVNLDLVDCLQLCDKRAVAEKSAKIRQSLQMSRPEVEDFLKRAEELRNELAHAQDFLAHRSWSEILRLVTQIEQALDAFDGSVSLDFEDLPSEVAVGIAQHRNTKDLADSLATALNLDEVGRDLLQQELVGLIAQAVDGYLRSVDPI